MFSRNEICSDTIDVVLNISNIYGYAHPFVLLKLEECPPHLSVGIQSQVACQYPYLAMSCQLNKVVRFDMSRILIMNITPPNNFCTAAEAVTNSASVNMYYTRLPCDRTRFPRMIHV